MNCARSLFVAILTLFSPAVFAAASILVFGDSLSAGYGIRQDAAWPALLNKRLAEKRLDYSVINASISGETTSGGRSRLDAALQTPAVKTRLKGECERALAAGVFGSPHVIIDGEHFFGADRLPQIARWLREG